MEKEKRERTSSSLLVWDMLFFALEDDAGLPGETEERSYAYGGVIALKLQCIYTFLYNITQLEDLRMCYF